MQDEHKFDPEKISLIEFKLIKGQVDTPEDFISENIAGFHIENTMQLGFNLDEKLAKADFTAEIKTETEKASKTEATGNFHFTFIFSITNLDQLVSQEKKKQLLIDPNLANALSSIAYSTSRGILITRLQGTALQNFILPVINPGKLLNHK